MINTKFPVILPTSVTAFAAAIALVLSPAATAQDSEEKKVSARVLVLGANEARVHQVEDAEALFLEVKKAAQRDAVSLHLTSLRGAYLGVELVNLNEPLRAHFGVPEGSGVLVSNVIENSPAARAGVLVGDILTRFDGEEVASSRRLTPMVRRAEAGDPADLEIWRDGKVERLSTTLDERPRPDLRAGSFSFSFRGREDLDGDGEVDVFVGRENMHEKIQEYFNGDEWKERHETMQRFLHERRPDMKALEERLVSLKERLAELEHRLEQKAKTGEN